MKDIIRVGLETNQRSVLGPPATEQGPALDGMEG